MLFRRSVRGGWGRHSNRKPIPKEAGGIRQCQPAKIVFGQFFQQHDRNGPDLGVSIRGVGRGNAWHALPPDAASVLHVDFLCCGDVLLAHIVPELVPNRLHDIDPRLALIVGQLANSAAGIKYCLPVFSVHGG